MAGLPLAFILSPGQAGDTRYFQPVLDKIRVRNRVGRPSTRPKAVAADRAYSSKSNRTYLRRRGITAVIPDKSDQQANRKNKGSRGGRPISHDTDRYKQRTVERCFQKVKTWRSLATRYDCEDVCVVPDGGVTRGTTGKGLAARMTKLPWAAV